MLPSGNKTLPYQTITLDSSGVLGIGITAEAFNRDYGFNYPTFPEGKEYPIRVKGECVSALSAARRTTLPLCLKISLLLT